MSRPASSPPDLRRQGPRLLLVEDEESLVLTLGDRLRAEGYRLEACGDAESALAALAASPFDLAILDVMLPGMDGFALCRELRHRGYELPVLMLTARAQVVDRVVGLKLGADDYLTKPFEMIELLARLEALLRRRGTATRAADVHAFGEVRADFRRAEVTREGRPLALSSLEMRLLRYFLEHRGEVLTRDRLLDEVWGYDATPVSRTVDVHVASLRAKVEANPSHPVHIVTVHRVGYRFDG
ncbi:MAG: response regulator transcription factor [Holophagales bacterium]|nr:MAG: response regulator transcription factor [Holophagales bacterium]